MPYVIHKSDNDQFCVYKQAENGDPEGEALGCHDTEDGAKQQLAALYANADEATKAGRVLSGQNASQIVDAVNRLIEVLGRAGIDLNAPKETEAPTPDEPVKSAEPIADDEPIFAFGSAIKSIGENRFGGYIVEFTDAQKKDLDQQYFAGDTDFMLKYSQPPRPLMYHHGMDKTLKKSVMGDIDTLKLDQHGIYGEGEYAKADAERWSKEQIALHNQYVNAIKDLVDRGVLHFSSGSAPHLVEIKGDGKIVRWPIVEVSATPTPANQYGVTRIYNLKSYSALFVDQTATEVETAKEPEGREEPVKEPMKADVPETVFDNPSTESRSEENMDIQKMCEAALKALQDAGISLSPEQQQAFAAAMQQQYAQPEAVAGKSAAEFATEFVKAAKATAESIKAAELVASGMAASFAAAPITNALPPARPANGNGHISDVRDVKYDSVAPEDLVFGAQIMSHAAKSNVPGSELPSDRMLRAAHERMGRALEYDNNPWGKDNTAVKSAWRSIKSDEIIATNITAPGYWVGTAYSAQLWEQVRIATIYQELLSRGMMEVTVPQGYSSIYIPTDGGANTTWYSLVELNDETSDERMPITARSSTIAPNRRQLSLGFVGARNSFSDVMNEDSLIPVLPFLRRNHEVTARETTEYLILNGDTATGASTNINLIDGTPSVDAKGRGPAYLAMDGMLKLPLVTTTTLSRDGKGFDETDFLATFNLLPATEQDESKTMFILGRKTMTAAMNIPAFKTRDVFNPATLEGGKLTQVWGIDTFVSGQLALAYTAGKISTTGSNNAYGRVLCVRPDRWALGRHREVTTEVARDIDAQATVVVTTMRFGITSFGTTGGAAVTYDLTVTT